MQIIWLNTQVTAGTWVPWRVLLFRVTKNYLAESCHPIRTSKRITQVAYIQVYISEQTILTFVLEFCTGAGAVSLMAGFPRVRRRTKNLAAEMEGAQIW